jgi:hypothetical protein
MDLYTHRIALRMVLPPPVVCCDGGSQGSSVSITPRAISPDHSKPERRVDTQLLGMILLQATTILTQHLTAKVIRL